LFYVQIRTKRLYGWYRRRKSECSGQAFLSLLFHVIFLLSSSSGLTGYQGFARLEGGRLILEGVASLCSGRAILGCFPSSCFFFVYHIYSECFIPFCRGTLVSWLYMVIHRIVVLLYCTLRVDRCVDGDSSKCRGEIIESASNRLA
jgi:hypothetical protein